MRALLWQRVLMNNAEYKRQWYLANKSRLCEKAKAYRELHREILQAQTRLWRKNHPEKCAEHRRKWAAVNPDKDRAAKQAYEVANPENRRGASARRRARRLKASPPWLTLEQRKERARIYRECPVGHEVDHIVPVVKGGPHIAWNLQILTRAENRKKGVRYIFDDWCVAPSKKEPASAGSN